ncbi:MAG: helix-turn-helix domain-containing protein, partial [Verrucomicrobiales bacterium]
PVDVQLDVTKTVLAAELHVRNETLSRVLNRLVSLGLIETRGRVISVVNPAKLSDFIESRS